MSTRATHHIVWLGLLIAGLNGCGSSGDSTTTNGDTINNGVTTPPDASTLHAQPDSVDKTAWKVPRYSLNEHQEVQTTAWTMNPEVASDTRPHVLSGLQADQFQVTASGQYAREPNNLLIGGSPTTTPVIFESYSQFLGTTWSGYVARSATDEVLRYVAPYYVTPSGWLTALPADATVGTTWTSSGFGPFNAGKMLVYKQLGTISAWPTIRTIDGAPLAGTDPALAPRKVACDAAGNETADRTQVALDYQQLPGFQAAWINVASTQVWQVAAVAVATPDGHYSGCTRVTLSYRFKSTDAVPADLTQTLGWDAFAGNFTLYWKPGIGWVWWQGSIARPVWGYAALPRSKGATLESVNIAGGNSSSDSGRYNFGQNYNSSPQVLYTGDWAAGYLAAYRDQSFTTPYYLGGNYSYFSQQRKPLDAALAEYLASINANVGQSEYQYARSATASAAFTAGYQTGTAYYAADIQEVANDSDILNTGVTPRFNLTLAYNAVPDAYRPGHILWVDNLLRINFIANTQVGQFGYLHGFDGMGIVTDAYDATVGTTLDTLRIKSDASGHVLTNIYVALPCLSSVQTFQYSGAITAGGLVTGGG
jgi:hypothetical protein